MERIEKTYTKGMDEAGLAEFISGKTEWDLSRLTESYAKLTRSVEGEDSSSIPYLARA